ncbi:hypothetical protein BBO99_00008136 [Phytophthora kernoviae]|uniref:C2H2-type domain-containing protein n=2 Tax=Phytophthora kernoviae TaxID=325452 RepID=A0A3R7J5K3_9STRA|nr:hypothetical protein G195_008800 [Phytophthora kernoviae 00238/432]KAG2513582.1 hypothetical protein JM16_007911 [Phytophthora kernoviae]KAG2519385.1 hypothetical protein JM18_007573 [Phytophthora kernoviae]RLN06351.1 hypothetical protein BBI17_008062 [Phytophthora kernoviae]RLN75688.1 hypothetical protein BBO99_00008136 [Phytophthora kernoviae]
MNNNVLAITTATTRDSDSVSSVGSFLSLKRQRLNEEGASAAKEAKVKDSSSDPSIAEENTGENTHKNATIAAPTSSGYPSMALSLQKDPSWMLGDDSFGSLVRQIDDDGYAFDLGQMNENTVWAISDYVKDSMIELDGYIKSIASANADVSSEEQRQSTTTVLTSANISSNATDSSTTHQLSNDLALNSSKMSAITNNENQNKFLEQVEMYSKPKVTKSRVKPSKKHECPTCSKQFRGRSELQNHIRTHTGEKPLKCSYAGCTKRYAHSSNLRAHERTHAGVKPYACHYDGCGKSFAHSVSLKEHIWMHAGFQPYVCPYENCSKKFTQVSNFARHKKTHEKEERTSENEHSVESDN